MKPQTESVANYLLEDFPDHPAVLRMRKKSQLRRLIERDGLKCHWCGRFCNPGLVSNSAEYPTREHVIRKADGGSSRMENQRLACRKCNNSRHAPGWFPGKRREPKLRRPSAGYGEVINILEMSDRRALDSRP